MNSASGARGRFGGDVAITVGERVTLDGDPNTEYVVISVNQTTGRAELLRLNPGRIEHDISLSLVRRKEVSPAAAGKS